jgi:hypothetical protein
VTSAVKNLTGSDIVSLTERQRDTASGLKFDFLFEVSSQDQREKIAVLIVGPYTNKKMYRDRCEWIARAFGLAWVVDCVMLVVPAAEYLEAYRDHAPEIAAMDLFVVPTIGFDLLYAFVIPRQPRLAEWLCRTADRIDPARVCGPHRYFE